MPLPARLEHSVAHVSGRARSNAAYESEFVSYQGTAQ